MIEVEVNNSIYQGRLISIHANEEIFDSPDGTLYYRNTDYVVDMMDANGVKFIITINDLNKITFMG